MKALLKNIHSPEVYNLADFIPPQEDNFCFLLQLIVSPSDEKLGEKCEESFDVTLCTPRWLIENHTTSDVIIGRHYLIVFEYNYQRIYSKLKIMIERVEAITWEEIAIQIGRIGKWEFEDYKEQ